MAGSMRKLSGDRWELRVPLPRDPVTGKRRQLSRVVYGSQRQASAALAELFASRNQVHTRTATLTVNDLFADFIERKIAFERAASTIQDYRSKWRNHVGPHIGNLPAASVTVEHIDAMYAALLSAGVSANNIAAIHRVVRAVFRWAARRHLILFNPADGAERPTPTPNKTLPPDAQIVRSFLAHLDDVDPELAVFVRLSAVVGPRRSETCSLKWSDVDFEACTISVLRARDPVAPATSEETKPTKAHDQRINEPLDTRTCEMLAALKAEWTAKCGLCGITPGDDAFIFSPKVDGSKPVPGNTISKRIARLRRNVPGAEDLTLKKLRTFVPSMLAEAGFDPVIGQHRLGHHQLSTTQHFYTSATSAASRSAANHLGTVLDDSTDSE